MRRDRYGEPIEDGPADEGVHTTDTLTAQAHRCRRGWIDRDSDRPRPCYQCKPWLIPRNDETEDTTP